VIEPKQRWAEAEKRRDQLQAQLDRLDAMENADLPVNDGERVRSSRRSTARTWSARTPRLPSTVHSVITNVSGRAGLSLNPPYRLLVDGRFGPIWNP